MAQDHAPDHGPHFEDGGETAWDFLFLFVVSHHGDATERMVDSVFSRCAVEQVERHVFGKVAQSLTNPVADIAICVKRGLTSQPIKYPYSDS